MRKISIREKDTTIQKKNYYLLNVSLFFTSSF
jgi:hypothetical protein